MLADGLRSPGARLDVAALLQRENEAAVADDDLAVIQTGEDIALGGDLVGRPHVLHGFGGVVVSAHFCSVCTWYP